MMSIRPLHDRILARRVVEQDKTKGGLFIPDNAKQKPLEAIVIAMLTTEALIAERPKHKSSSDQESS